MRKTFCLCLLPALLSGCGRTAPPPLADAAVPQVSPLSPIDADHSGSPTETYQGRTVTQWSGMLDSPDPAARDQACRALQQLGNDGFKPLLNGMQSNSWQHRLTCMQAVHKPVMIAHADETWPQLVRLLGDQQPLIRQHAAIRLAWFSGTRGPAAIQELQRVAARESDPEVKRTVVDTIKGIELAMAGKKPDVGPKR